MRLSGAPDPLDFDDSRFFTFKVQPAMKVLVVSDRDERRPLRGRRPRPASLPPGTPRPCQVERSGPRSSTRRPGRRSRTTPPSSCFNVKELERVGLGPPERLRPRGRRPGRRPGRVTPTPRTTTSRVASQLIPGFARSKKESPRKPTFRQDRRPDPSRSSDATRGSSTRCSRRSRSTTTGRSRRPRGRADPALLLRRCPGAHRAVVPRGQRPDGSCSGRPPVAA